MLQSGLKAGPRTPFPAPDISPYRRFAWISLELDEVKTVKNALGGTINDVVLATTTGAIRRFLEARDIDVDSIEGFRAFLPVNTRKTGGVSTGNQVAMLLAELPVSEPDPIKRLEKVIAITTTLKKESNQTAGTELLEDVADLTTKRLILDISRGAIMRRAYNVVVTNIPGPPFPLYLLGAQLKAMFPLVPIPPTQNLGIALFSYNGRLHWGFNADWQGFPDVHEFVQDIEATFEEYKRLAAAPELSSARAPSARHQRALQ